MPDSEFDYATQMRQLDMLARAFAHIVESAPLEEMRSTLGDAHALGPFVDPTKYRDALYNGSLDYQLAVIEAARVFRDAWREQCQPILDIAGVTL